MIKFIKKRLLVFFGIMLYFSCFFKINASGSRLYYYMTKNVFASFQIAFGSLSSSELTEEENKREDKFFDNYYLNIERSMKYLFGFEKLAVQTNQKIEVFYQHQYHSQFESEVDLQNELMRLIKIKKHSSFRKPDFFSGYTLQIAYVTNEMNVFKEKAYWDKKLDPIIGRFDNNDGNWREKISNNNWLGIAAWEEGDECPDWLKFPRIWLYSFKNGNQAVRFGLFYTATDAIEAAHKLKLEKNHIQVYPIKMSAAAFYNLVMKQPFF